MKSVLISLVSAVVLGWTSLVSAQSFPEPLDKAIAIAEAHGPLQASFDMRASHPGFGSVLLRFDATTQTWTMIEGSLEGVDKTITDELEHLKGEVSKPGELLYAGMRRGIRNPVYAGETETDLIYTAQVGEQGGREVTHSMREALDIQLYVDKQRGHITRFSMQSRQPFKPAAAAKIEELVVEQEYARVNGSGPALITKLYNKAEGSAMFQPFQEEFTLEFFNHQLIY